MKLLSRMIAEADKCIGKDDMVQASEKLYEVAGFHEARLVSVVEKWGF
jgi:hypothetical protein